MGTGYPPGPHWAKMHQLGFDSDAKSLDSEGTLFLSFTEAETRSLATLAVGTGESTHKVVFS